MAFPKPTVYLLAIAAVLSLSGQVNQPELLFHKAPKPLSPEAVIKVSRSLTDIDFPICLDYFDLEYYDTLYNETGFEKTFKRFVEPQSILCTVEIVYYGTA